jgi:hypothetical protein
VGRTPFLDQESQTLPYDLITGLPSEELGKRSQQSENVGPGIDHQGHGLYDKIAHEVLQVKGTLRRAARRQAACGLAMIRPTMVVCRCI